MTQQRVSDLRHPERTSHHKLLESHFDKYSGPGEKRIVAHVELTPHGIRNLFLRHDFLDLAAILLQWLHFNNAAISNGW
jgi:hypothetical protein